MTGDCYVFKLVRRGVDGNYLIRFQSETSVSISSRVVQSGPTISMIHNKYFKENDNNFKFVKHVSTETSVIFS